MKKNIFIPCLFVFWFLASNQSAAQCDRATIVNDYNTVYVPSAVTQAELAWTGSTSTCTPGTISPLANARFLARINYFRKLVGQAHIGSFDAAKNAKCQEAALMMTANGQLSHSPPSTWLCYTANGSQAASSSNLSSTFSSNAISLYMDDFGTNNGAVGHRRWILNSAATSFGHGATNTYDALWVTGQNGPGHTNWYAYPSPGFFPKPLYPTSGRWSFSKANANFGSATVEMTNASGSPLAVMVAPVSNGSGDNTIVWTVNGIILSSQYDEKYNVKVQNVMVNGAPQTYSYQVRFCEPVHPPVCPVGKMWSQSACDCVSGTDVADALQQPETVQITNPFGSALDIGLSGPVAGNLTVTVRNMQGATVASRSVSVGQAAATTLSIPAESWAPGMYFIDIKNGRGESRVYRAIRN